MNILVIDDHPVDRKLARHVLTAAGHSVTGTEAAETAFASIRNERPDLILLDMSLPGMDGLALVRLLKADPATREIHIVAITSYPENFPREELLAAGCDAYLVKPVSTRTLPETLSNVVTQGKLPT